MSFRIKIELPEKQIHESEIPVRITDLNYGAHVGNDRILTYAHEVRMNFLAEHGFTDERDVDGVGLIMADAAIQFTGEGFYGMILKAELFVGEVTSRGFDLYYHLSDRETGKSVAKLKTGMLCFNYDTRRLATMPDGLSEILNK